MIKILIVEDNELNRDMLYRRLSRRGFQVVTAVNGEQGLAMARAEQPDVILMDLRLPDLSGWDVATVLKSDPATESIGIIALTAHAMEGHRQQALAAGCDDYDTKPVELARLLNKIQVLLAKRGQSSDSSSEELPLRETA
jgi:two-component system, cell cycle response regulator DivK